GNAVDRGWNAGHEGAIVRVGEAGQCRVRLARKTVTYDTGEGGQLTRREPHREVVRIAAIKADDCHGTLRHRIGPAVDHNGLRFEVAWHAVSPALFPLDRQGMPGLPHFRQPSAR